VPPPDPDLGDLALPCFRLSRGKQKPPQIIAQQLVSFLTNDKIIAQASAVGPYVNISLSHQAIAQGVLEDIMENKKYGINKQGQGKRVMIEFSNANTHKSYHVGHLRNLCYGEAVAKILAACGYKSISVSYINDFGIHTAKTLWELKQSYRGEKIPDDAEARGELLGSIYEKAVSKLDSEPDKKAEISQIMAQLEARKGPFYDLWLETRQWSIDYFAAIYKKMKISFTHTFYESEFIEAGRKLVDQLLEQGVLTKSKGVVIADLEKYKLGVLVFLRSDGTALYPVADLPLAIEKIKKFSLDISIYVVDVRQSLYFKQLFKLLELMGYKQKFVHLGYEFVKLPSGMMSSRTGNVITFTELYSKIFSLSYEETKKRHSDWSAGKIKQTAHKITIGAIKFEMLKVGADKIITFDIKEALRFDGFTAAYLQYTYARLQSILRKAGNNNGNGKTPQLAAKYLLSSIEYSLLLKLAYFPLAVERAGQEYDPSEVARYLFELAQEFNEYYHQVPVLQADKPKRAARLLLLQAVGQVIKNGLGLLGIEVLDEM
jgi:arginyl-tRNA synthetase